MDKITTTQTNKGEYLFYQSVAKGAQTSTLLQAIIKSALKQLPIPKRMRWGDKTVEFVRPVHWLIVKHGEQVVPCSILGVASGSESKGHRFHHPSAVIINKVEDYEQNLEKVHVVASFEKRKIIIEQQSLDIAKAQGAIAIIEPSLLDEVTGLVEWPVAIMGEFEAKFWVYHQKF